ncbi:hypothetical protein [Hydrogenophaga sp.]|uniref:hypothetical protein n=1 Tax=Hydrogenophaga sp. TaxID=1904254 RepID=UPI002730D179|nr:hypothetical protein [Hydrogenophaga sp.]MDP2015446.1 hypothetical protein [Hydrogenophaga sp.]MDP3167367.1 hypothetical protein [Hydrogenophaga sp.]
MKPQNLLKTWSLVVAFGLPLSVLGAELVRWTDDGGRVTYGVITDVPQRYASRAVPANAPLPPGTTACEARWHRYAASAACFDQYRVVGGGLKPEAFQRCTEMPQPDCN